MRRAVFPVIRALAKRRIEFDLDLVPLRFDGLSWRRIFNWILTETSVRFKPSRPWGLPTILQLEPASRCNLRCTVCPVATGMDRPAGDLSFDLFRRIIDEVGDTLLVLMFWDWGEPFLNPRSYEMIAYARAKGIKVVASTNGHVFAERENARRLVDCGLDLLVFSVDGITQETYEHYRRAGRLESVKAGIRQVVEERRRRGAKTPVVNFRFIVMKHDEHEIPELASFARSLGVDVLTLRKFYAVPGSSNGADSYIPSEARFQLPRLGADGQALRAHRNPCRNLWNCPTIHWNGAVCSCFMDFKERRPLGLLGERSFRDIWRGREYSELRQRFRTDWPSLPLCRECACGFEGGDVGREANEEAIFF
jgi:MoaA/NifB/PqqE/SkfB family radical SAM enzyme